MFENLCRMIACKSAKSWFWSLQTCIVQSLSGWLSHFDIMMRPVLQKTPIYYFRYILVKFLHKYLFVDAIFFLRISEVSTCCSKATGSCRTVCEKVRHYIFNKNKTGLLKFQIWIQNEYIMQHFVLFSFWNVPFSFGSLCSVSVYFYSALVNLFSLQHFYTVDKFSYFLVIF